MSKELASKILNAIDGLPPFSQIADEALVAERKKSLNEDPTSEGVFHDPRFAKQILEMTNFASLGFSGQKAGSFESGMLEGRDVLRGLMSSYSLHNFMSKELKAYHLREGELWEHTMNAAFFSWMVATKVGNIDLETIFVAGMMHDIGKVVLDRFLYEGKEKFVDITKQGNLSVVEAEKQICGMDHAEAGARMAEKWDFDGSVVEAIRFHHQPELAERDPDLATIVHLADYMCTDLSVALTSDVKGYLQTIFKDRNLSSAI